MNQLPYDIQLIVYKYLHISAMTDTHRDMMNQLRSKEPHLRAMGYYDKVYDKNLHRRICLIQIITSDGTYYNKYFIRLWKGQDFIDDWHYPAWYFLTSDAFIEVRKLQDTAL